jgi:hypothetical protein
MVSEEGVEAGNEVLDRNVRWRCADYWLFFSLGHKLYLKSYLISSQSLYTLIMFLFLFKHISVASLCKLHTLRLEF